jgi:hypothetical protein
MTDSLRDSLGRMLDTYDERKRAQKALEKKIRDEDAAFLTRFAELRKTIIRPVLEEAGEVLRARGHEFSISETEFAGGGTGELTEAGITFIIVPQGVGGPLSSDTHGHSFSMTTRHYSKTVWIDGGKAMNAGGASGSKNAYPLDRIDRALVEEALLKFVAGVVEV